MPAGKVQTPMHQVAAPTPRQRRVPPPAARRSVPSGPIRLRRIALVAALVALLPVLGSYLGVLTEASNSSLGIRSVEWLRENGAAGIVSKVESVYYTLTAPSKGGPALHAVPKVGYGIASGQASAAEERPDRVHAVLHPALPGEGVWHAIRPNLASSPPVLITTVRDQPEYPRVVAGLAWLDTKRTTLALSPGRLEPSVGLPRGEMMVPRARRAGLLATFNSGFKLADDKGGFAVNGHTYAAMRNGQATLVGYTNGSVDVLDWQYGTIAPANVSFARQNLPLIVNNGEAASNIENSGEWGVTVGNAVLVWRSAIGIDAHGNLIYASGPDQSVGSIARVLIHAGAVRAMELDINSYWTSFITYGAPGAGQPSNLLPDMERSDTRYLEPDDRDFFTVYAR
jgi:Phosphodiester glycosidase